MDKYSTKDLTKDILLFVSGLGLVPLLVLLPGLPLAIKPFLPKNYPTSRVKNTVGRLQKNKLIKISEINGKTQIEILEKGQRKILKYQMDSLSLKMDKWDGLWRIVIFDIPERNRIARDILRSKLKEIGMFKLQKSVLITPWDCKEIIEFVKHYYEVAEYVSLITSHEIDGEENLKKYFKL